MKGEIITIRSNGADPLTVQFTLDDGSPFEESICSAAVYFVPASPIKAEIVLCGVPVKNVEIDAEAEILARLSRVKIGKTWYVPA